MGCSIEDPSKPPVLYALLCGREQLCERFVARFAVSMMLLCHTTLLHSSSARNESISKILAWLPKAVTDRSS